TEECADLEIAGGDVDGLGDLAPVVEVAQDLPVLVAVVHDEEFAARLAGSVGHRASLRLRGTGGILARGFILPEGSGQSNGRRFAVLFRMVRAAGRMTAGGVPWLVG